MYFRHPILLAAILGLNGLVNALPAPQLTVDAPILGEAAGSGDTVTVATDGNPKTTAQQQQTTQQVVTESSVQQAPTTQAVVTITPVTPTTSAEQNVVTSTPSDTPSTTAAVQTSSVAVPSTTLVPVTTSSAQNDAARVAASTTTANTPTASSTQNFPTINAITPSTPGTPTSTTSSTPSATSQPSSSSGTNTKTILIVGGVVGSFVILAFIAFSIFRKLKLKPSREFNERIEPVTQGHLEEWNDPRTFRGIMMQNSGAQGLERSNSTASSRYSFDAADEKAGMGAGPGAGLTRGNTNGGGLTRGNTNGGGLARGNTNGGSGGGVERGNTIRKFEKVYPFEQGDGLREDGRGYRGF